MHDCRIFLCGYLGAFAKKFKMLRVYFDGSIESAGQVIAACRSVNRRVFVVTHRRLTDAEARFLQKLEDCGGTLGAWTNGRYKQHRAHGSARGCARVVSDGVVAFFEGWTDDERVDGDMRAARVEGLHTCDRYSCRECATCARVEAIAEQHGVYDVLDDFLKT